VNRFGSQTTAAFGARSAVELHHDARARGGNGGFGNGRRSNIGAKRLDRVPRVAATGVAFNLLMNGPLVVLIYLFIAVRLACSCPPTALRSRSRQHINAIVVWSFMLFGHCDGLGRVVRATGAAVPPLIVLFWRCG